MINSSRPYYLGCPIWANKEWIGRFFSSTAKSKDFLAQYSSVLNAVEGNTTFYGLPQKMTVEKWQKEAADGFKFSFKFPKQISHVLQLSHAQQATSDFFNRLESLGDKLGCFFLQLPPTFNKNALPYLKQYLTSLPNDFTYAVEMRHSDFYTDVQTEQRLNELLSEFAINRVMFDTATLHQIKSNDPVILAAQNKKPKHIGLLIATANMPMVRFVGHQTPEPNIKRLTEIAEKTAEWINKGKTPIIFMHSPDDLFAPDICCLFHQILATKIENLPDLPPYPCETEIKPPEQLSLF